jgi:hypothetical protein
MLFIGIVVVIGVICLIIASGACELIVPLLMAVFLSLMIRWAYMDKHVSDVETSYNITHVERRLDGTTHVYVKIDGELISKEVPDGIDLLTDEQLTNNCFITKHDITKRNEEKLKRYTLDY